MHERIGAAALLLAALGAGASACASELKTAHVHFEQNATDRDAEVVFAAKGRAVGLAKLVVTGPDGRTVIDFTAPDASTLGMREFLFESPEPPDVELVKAAYPEGTYRFRGEGSDGEVLTGEARLSHALPPPTDFVVPTAGQQGVPTDLVLHWKPVAGAAGYVVEIVQGGLDESVHARLPGDANSFQVPRGLLRPGTAYELEIGSVNEAGNITFIESWFETAK